MNRYEVKVLVTYKLDAESVEEARKKILEGAEYPVVPYDDNTYCSEDKLISVEAI